MKPETMSKASRHRFTAVALIALMASGMMAMTPTTAESSGGSQETSSANSAANNTTAMPLDLGGLAQPASSHTVLDEPTAIPSASKPWVFVTRGAGETMTVVNPLVLEGLASSSQASTPAVSTSPSGQVRSNAFSPSDHVTFRMDVATAGVASTGD